MHIGYLISVIVSYYSMNKLSRKIIERFKEDGYVATNFKHNHVKEVLIQAIIILFPVLNLLFPLYCKRHFNEIYEKMRFNFINEGKLRNRTAEDDLIIEKNIDENDNLKINNILSAKSLQEEKIPGWKKTIQYIYDQISRFLKSKNIIEEEKEEVEIKQNTRRK